jgi:hypothetical protein
LLALFAFDPADFVLDNGHGLVGRVQGREEVFLVVVEADFGAVEAQMVGEFEVILGGKRGRLVLLGESGYVRQSSLEFFAIEAFFKLEILERVGRLDPLREVDS